MHKNDSKRMKTVQRRYKRDHTKETRNAAEMLYVAQYLWIGLSLMTAFVTESIATDTYSKIMSRKTGQFRIVETSPRAVSIYVYGISNIVLFDQVALAPILFTVQDVMENVNNGNN